MEIRIVIFLAFVSVTVITNSLLIWFVYKAFASLTSKVTETVFQFETNQQTKEWLATLESAAAQAVSVTESTKLRIAEVDTVLEHAQHHYRETLATVDSKLETVANEITANARKVRDVVAGPAFSIVSFAAGLAQVLETMDTEE